MTSSGGSVQTADASARLRLVDSVAAEYGLTDVEILGDLGRWGDTLRLHCRTAGGFQFLLKEKAYYLTGSEWPLHLAVHGWSGRAGGPVSRLLTTAAGEAGVYRQGRWFEAQEWVDGRRPGEGVAELRDFGRALALFHRSVADMPTGSWERPECRFRWCPDQPTVLATYIERHCAPRLRPGSLAAERLTGLYALVKELPWDPTALVESYLHGDTAPANCVRSVDGQLALIDFDDARWGYRLFDLAHAIAVVAGVRRDGEGHETVRRDWDRRAARALLDGYASVIDVTADEYRLFGQLMTVATVAAGLSCLDVDDPEFEPRADLDDQLCRLAALVDDIPVFTSAVTGG